MDNKTINHEEVELQCLRLLQAKTSEERSDILKDSLGYMGLAQAYVELAAKLHNAKMQCYFNNLEGGL